MILGCTVRIFPTKEQEALIWKHIHACRFIWNYMLDFQQKRHDNNEKYVSGFVMNNMLTPMKKQEEYVWLTEVSNMSLQRTCGNLSETLKRFLKRQNAFPRFKSKKKSRPSYPVRNDSLAFYDKYLTVEKVGKLKYKTDYIFPKELNHKFKNVQIYIDQEKYYISFSYDKPLEKHELTDSIVGIDVGIKEFATVATDGKIETYHNINKSKKMRSLEKRIKFYQKALSRKYRAARNENRETSANIEKTRRRLARVCRRARNIRKDYIHKLSYKIVSSLPKIITIETLGVKSFLVRKINSKYFSKLAVSSFLRQIEYKGEKYGVRIVKADRFYPSSKTCSNCGEINEKLKLSDRTFKCDACGFIINRDHNAAINLMKYGAQLG